MLHIIKAEIYHDGEYYCGKCLDFDVFTQGKTLDDVVANLKEAIQLHLEDEPRDVLQVAPHPSLFTIID
jgi:predicted RNase H-like HicB family nuclease